MENHHLKTLGDLAHSLERTRTRYSMLLLMLGQLQAGSMSLEQLRLTNDNALGYVVLPPVEEVEESEEDEDAS